MIRGRVRRWTRDPQHPAAWEYVVHRGKRVVRTGHSGTWASAMARTLEIIRTGGGDT